MRYEYDADARRIRETLFNGNTVIRDTRIAYDAFGRMVRIADPSVSWASLPPRAINPQIDYVVTCVGSKRSTLKPSIGPKCLTLAVSNGKPCSRAVAAIRASPMPRP